jgi:hypothetical protein
MKWAEHTTCIGEMKNAYRILVGNGEEKRPLGRPKLSCEDNIKTNLQEMICGGVDWVRLAQGCVEYRSSVNTVMSFRVS